MNKILVALLLVTAVIGLSMPGMANPHVTIDKTVHDAQTAANTATSSASQTLSNSGAQSNDAVVLALGGNGDAISEADAIGSATNDGKAKVNDGYKAKAGNKDSGNADAISEADATGGSASNGNVYQKNKVLQDADADLSTIQSVGQGIADIEIFIPIVKVEGSMFDNTIGGDNLVELDAQGCGCDQRDGGLGGLPEIPTNVPTIVP